MPSCTSRTYTPGRRSKPHACGKGPCTSWTWSPSLRRSKTCHSQRDALGSHLIILLTHLLKLATALRDRPHDLTRAGRGWRGTCRTQRLQIAKRLRRNPSLRTTVPEECADAYEIARVEAAIALDVDEATLPLVCPWTPAQVLDADFWPAAEEGR